MRLIIPLQEAQKSLSRGSKFPSMRLKIPPRWRSSSCPKGVLLVNSNEKQTEIIRENDIKSMPIVCMEVPCCGSPL